jgi:hypothetical protein
MANPPPTPPIVLVRAGRDEPHAAFLICWERGESEGSAWSAWVMWVKERDGKPFRHTVLVGADMVERVEAAAAYRDVPRRIRCADGSFRPWSPPGP